MTTHKLVPVEPTEAMQWSGWRAKDAVFSSAASPDRDPANCFRAMLTAAPNEGRVSRAAYEAAVEAAIGARYVGKGGIAIATAVIAALGLEIEGE